MDEAARAPPRVLEISGLCKSFAGFRAVSDVSLTVETQQIAAVIGPNGAGKSTLFNLDHRSSAGANSGTVRLDGRDITGAPPHRICRMGVGRSFQRTNIFTKLTVFENLQAAYLVHHRRGTNFWSRSETLYRDETATLLTSIGLAGQENTIAGTLSYGNQKQLGTWPRAGEAIRGCCCWMNRQPACRRPTRRTRRYNCLLERIAAERGELDAAVHGTRRMEVVFSIAQKIAVLQTMGKVIAERLHLDAMRGDAEVRRVKYLRHGLLLRVMTALLSVQDIHLRLRPQPSAVRHLARSRGRRVRHLPGTQRRGQDHDDTFGDGLAATIQRPCGVEGHRHRRLETASASRAPVSASCQEDRRIFAELTVWENLDIAARAAAVVGVIGRSMLSISFSLR